MLNYKLNRNKIISDFYKIIENNNSNTKKIWFHSSSMGEFEQVKYIIELLKKELPQIKIICTFFSNSGYENQKNYKFADYISYLPIDTKDNAKKFIETLKPNLAVFVRYDLWLNFLINLKERNIPSLLINATYPKIYKNKIIFKLIKSYYIYTYSLISEIFAVNNESFNFFKNELSYENVYQSKDTRLDRIAEIVDQSKKHDILPNEIINSQTATLVAGSTWEKDIELLGKLLREINKDKFLLRAIIVPHKPEKDKIEQIENLIPNNIRLSHIENLDNNQLSKFKEHHLIVDKIGILLKLYKYADIAYVGCGFGDGVHSTAEPAGYGLPIITGPNINNSPDAIELHKIGALQIIKNEKELINWIDKLLSDNNLRTVIGEKSKRYMQENKGFSFKITKYIIEKLTKN
jgi:3-deoxy-D-manno-octulosonic-acid transferase